MKIVQTLKNLPANILTFFQAVKIMNKVEMLRFLDSDDSENEEYEMDEIPDLLQWLAGPPNLEPAITSLYSIRGNPRHCITNYIEEVIPRYSEEEFITHFRISRLLCHMIVEKFEDSLTFKELRSDKRFSAEKHILLFLWFAAHETCSFRDIGDRFDMTISSVSRIIKRVTLFISHLCDDTIKWPNNERKETTANFFHLKTGFPNVIGVIDGSHIIIDPPAEDKDSYIDREGNVSITLQGICDHEYRFIDIFVGFPGSTHDSRVFQNSFIYEQLESLCGSYFILGDSAYPCGRNVLTPYRDNGHLARAQKAYNKKLSSNGVQIENTFGISKQRFRQLYYCKLRGMEKLCHFVRACCVLHNMSSVDEFNFTLVSETATQETAGNDAPLSADEDTRTGRAARDLICQQLQQRN